jgi:hypothetical protein
MLKQKASPKGAQIIRHLRLQAIVGLVSASLVAPAIAQPPSSSQRPPPDPNERVCQDIIQTGSRLAKKRFCGTRQEWEDKRRQDREATEKAQTQLCVVNPATGKC